jgi:hypothetical protein
MCTITLVLRTIMVSNSFPIFFLVTVGVESNMLHFGACASVDLAKFDR